MLRKQYNKVPTNIIILSYVSRTEKTRNSTETTTLFMQSRIFALSNDIARCLESPDSESFIRPILSAICIVVISLSFSVSRLISHDMLHNTTSKRRQNRTERNFLLEKLRIVRCYPFYFAYNIFIREFLSRLLS